MAWENANIGFRFLCSLTNNGITTYSNKSQDWYQYNNSISTFRSTYGEVNTTDLDLRNLSSDIILIENEFGKLVLRNDIAVDLLFYIGNNVIATERVGNKTNNWAQYLSIYCLIDEINQLGLFMYGYTQQANGQMYLRVVGATNSSRSFYKSTNAYNLIEPSIIPSYNWQSVTSLTGKGKTVQLTTLNDINDGEEVITDDTSKFNLTTASNALVLVRQSLPN